MPDYIKRLRVRTTLELFGISLPPILALGTPLAQHTRLTFTMGAFTLLLDSLAYSRFIVFKTPSALDRTIYLDCSPASSPAVPLSTMTV